MSVDHSGHRQRLKRAERENGLLSFSPHEVIELMLYILLIQCGRVVPLSRKGTMV